MPSIQVVVVSTKTIAMADLLIKSAESRCLVTFIPELFDARRKTWLAGWPANTIPTFGATLSTQTCKVRNHTQFQNAPRVFLIERFIEPLTPEIAVAIPTVVPIVGACPISKTPVLKDALDVWHVQARAR